MITLQRRIFSLTAASPSSGAVIFCFAACISAIPYFHISIIHILPRHPFRRPIFSYIISPAASRPSYILINILPATPSAIPYYYIPATPSLAENPCIILLLLLSLPIIPYNISPATPAPADNPSIIYPPPRRWIHYFLVSILCGRIPLHPDL